jgi:hypothetical protein
MVLVLVMLSPVQAIVAADAGPAATLAASVMAATASCFIEISLGKPAE